MFHSTEFNADDLKLKNAATETDGAKFYTWLIDKVVD